MLEALVAIVGLALLAGLTGALLWAWLRATRRARRPGRVDDDPTAYTDFSPLITWIRQDQSRRKR